MKDENRNITLNKICHQNKEGKDIELKIKQLKNVNKIIPDDMNKTNNLIASNINNICQICFDEITSKAFQLKWAHLFCKECIGRIKRRNK
jgi:late competence protein required for DNA uptake (superfamily II DNA/RNA helicase)